MSEPAQYVYFIQRTDRVGPVKIGHSRRPSERLSSLMAWSPYPLQIVALIEGGEELERRLHAHLRLHHSHREWFHWCAAVKSVVDAAAVGRLDIDALPSPRALGPSVKRAPWTEEQRQRVRNERRIDRLSLRISVPADVRNMTRGDVPDLAAAIERQRAALDALEAKVAA